jgi:hypothetical protein
LATAVLALDLETRECWEERSAIIEFDAGVPRAQAERLALDDLVRASSKKCDKPIRRSGETVRNPPAGFPGN